MLIVCSVQVKCVNCVQVKCVNCVQCAGEVC